MGDGDQPSGKLAFVFPGQGSQKVGMGSEFLEQEPELFDRYLAEAEAAAGLPIRRFCLEGPLDALTATEVAQPALFALSLAVTEAARSAGLGANFVAGHSLGEYTAAVACGALDASDGMVLVCERGRLMSEAQSERPGAMAAIMGLTVERVAALCEAASEVGWVGLANLNTPTQTVVSGEEAGIDRLLELALHSEAQKGVRLQVGAAFHSVLMEPVQARLAEAMAALEWRDPHTPLVANASGRILTSGADVHQALVAQIASPVRWVDCVRAMRDAGCGMFLELGSGRVLSGLVRQIDREAGAFAADSPQKLRTFATSHPEFARADPG